MEESMPSIRKIVPCLWFDSQAEEAAAFYVSVFDRSRLGRISRYGEEGHEVHGRPAGSVMTVAFELEGEPFTALNGGPLFEFNEAISLQVMCETQDEIDRYWTKLSAGGDEKAQQCGWLKDRYGLSWQVSSTDLETMLTDPDQEKVDRVTQAFLKVDGEPFDIAALRAAFEGTAEPAGTSR
jgi:predicted 3-demethylubiquinone-9 3-methyltransferase (glyoxalase superfamily)